MVTVGIDLAKNVFALHGIDHSGKAVFIKPKVARSQLLVIVAHVPGQYSSGGEGGFGRISKPVTARSTAVLHLFYSGNGNKMGR